MNEKITIPLLAKDLNRLLEELQIEEAVFCSYSNGASIALEFALSYPKKTKALILASGFSEVSSFLLAQQFRVGMMTARLNGIKFLAKIFALSHTGEKAFQREIYEYVLKVNPQILYEMYKVGFTYNCTERLSEINKPVLLIYGQQDHYLHKYCKIFEKKLKYTETVLINQSKHQVPTKHFREFNKIIDQFLQNIPSFS